MHARKILVLIALAVVLSFVLTLALPDDAHAQDRSADKKVDKAQASKRTVSDSLSEGRGAVGEGPNKLQMALGIGSFVVMIIVVKWL